MEQAYMEEIENLGQSLWEAAQAHAETFSELTNENYAQDSKNTADVINYIFETIQLDGVDLATAFPEVYDSTLVDSLEFVREMYDLASDNYLSLPITDAIDDTFELIRNECENSWNWDRYYEDIITVESYCYNVYSNGEMIAYADGVFTSEDLTWEQYSIEFYGEEAVSYASTQALSHKAAVMKLRADNLVERQVLVAAETASSFNMIPAAIGGVALFAGAMFMKMRKSVDTSKDIKEPLV
jgi:hypothetical protein